MKFARIRDIEIDQSYTWENNIFVTVDIDWCSDAVLAFTLDILERNNIPATFFVTHNTPLLERIRQNLNFELGIHPNFNPLLQGDFCYGRNTNEVIEYYLKIVPDAISVRSHSMTQNSNVLIEFADAGLKYDCNHFIPFSAEIELKPWRLWDKRLIKVPYAWEDDVHCIYGWQWDVKGYLKQSGIKVFNFHPIHIFLNTENIKRYENARHFNFEKLRREINIEMYGTFDFIRDLIAFKD